MATPTTPTNPLFQMEALDRADRLASIDEETAALQAQLAALADKRAKAAAPAEGPKDVGEMCARARDATLDYLSAHKDMTDAAKPYRDMLTAIAGVFDAIAAQH